MSASLQQPTPTFPAPDALRQMQASQTRHVPPSNASQSRSVHLQSTDNRQSVSPSFSQTSGGGQDLATIGQSISDVNQTLLVGLIAAPQVIALMVVIVGIAAWKRASASTVFILLALVAFGGIMLYGGR